jgi:hypothetical protein
MPARITRSSAAALPGWARRCGWRGWVPAWCCWKRAHRLGRIGAQRRADPPRLEPDQSWFEHHLGDSLARALWQVAMEAHASGGSGHSGA